MFCSRDRHQEQLEDKPASKGKSVFELLETHLVGQDTVGEILKTREAEILANMNPSAAELSQARSLQGWQKEGAITTEWEATQINCILILEGWIKDEKAHKEPTAKGLCRGLIRASGVKDGVEFTYSKYTRKGLLNVLDLLKDKNPQDPSTWSQ